MKIIILLVSLFSFVTALASDSMVCQVHLTKPACWQKFDVKIMLLNGTTLKVLDTYHLKDNPVLTKKFDCKPGEVITFASSFDPSIWHNDKYKIFNAQGSWQVPQTLKKGISAWQVNICFPDAFQDVPMPITTQPETCTCNAS